MLAGLVEGRIQDDRLGDALDGQVTGDLQLAVAGRLDLGALERRGRELGDVEGTLVYDAADVTKSSVEVTLPLSGLNGFSSKFNDHLRSSDFFDIAKFPDATFKSTSVTANGGNKFTVAGDLTIKGTTHSVTVPLEYQGAVIDPWGNERIGFEGSVVVNRKDWGLTWNAAIESGGVLVSEKVTLEFEISAVKQA